MSKGLTATLANLIADSEKRSAPRSTQLWRGLNLQVHSTDEKFTLRTWRPNQLPDAREWQTVFDYLPKRYKPAVAPIPVQYVEDGRTVLSASWPAPSHEFPLALWERGQE